MGAEPITQMPSFARKSAFWRELSAAAGEHLAAETSKGRSRVGDPRLLRKAAVIVAWFILSYAALLSAPSLAVALLAAVSFAFAAAAIGFCIFHDANHRTLFKRPAGNLWAARLS